MYAYFLWWFDRVLRLMYPVWGHARCHLKAIGPMRLDCVDGIALKLQGRFRIESQRIIFLMIFPENRACADWIFTALPQCFGSQKLCGPELLRRCRRAVHRLSLADSLESGNRKIQESINLGIQEPGNVGSTNSTK